VLYPNRIIYKIKRIYLPLDKGECLKDEGVINNYHPQPPPLLRRGEKSKLLP